MSEAVLTAAAGKRSAAKAWLRALELTAPIPNNPYRTLPRVIEELSAKFPEQVALVSEKECLTYAALAQRVITYSCWGDHQHLAKGDVVCLLMPNRPEYMAIWLGITRIGAVVSLLNTNLAGKSLAHCINTVEAKHVIVAAELLDSFASAQPDINAAVRVWAHGVDHDEFERIDY